MLSLTDWAERWHIPAAAFAELAAGISDVPRVAPGSAASSEAGAAAEMRLEASQLGILMFRNNVGAMQDPETGRVIRFGLLNDSKQMNSVYKSPDWVGVRAVLITPQHVGHTIGQFVGREMKKPGWHYTGTGREAAQMNCARLINSRGGDVKFSTGAGTW